MTACRSALTTILRYKGRVLDETAIALQAIYRRANEADRALLDQLAAARTYLSATVLRGPEAAGLEAYRKALSKLELQIEELESQLNARSAEYRAQSVRTTFDDVRQAIPPGMSLIEFASYFSYNVRKKQYGERRYAVYVLQAQGVPVGMDLGAASDIDKAAVALRAALRNPGLETGERSANRFVAGDSIKIRQLARDLDAKIMAPVRKLLGNTTRLLISPDGALNLIPFEALVDEQGHYLIETLSISYLTSGRDLLRLRERIAGGQEIAVFADPDFGKAQGQLGGGFLAGAIFEPLPATAQEAEAIKSVSANQDWRVLPPRHQDTKPHEEKHLYTW